MSNTDYKTRSRGHIRTRVTKLHDRIRDSLDTLSHGEKLTSLTTLENLRVELRKLDNEICSAVWTQTSDEDALNAEWEGCDLYEQRILTSISTLKDNLGHFDAASNANPTSAEVGRLNKLKLPEIPLPKFSNAEGDNFESFLENFSSIISKYHLSDYEKFVYLKRQLGGEALTLIGSLMGAKQSYSGAIALLREAFADKVTQQYETISKLAELKLPPGGNAYEYVSQMRLLQDLFSTLDIKVETVLQYFIWAGLSSQLQSNLISISNTNKPSLKQINDNIFKAVNRAKEVSTSKVDGLKPIKPKVLSCAADVRMDRAKSNFKPRFFCSLCSEGREKRETSHSTKDCPKFPTPQQKLQRLRELNACGRCGFVNHRTSSCTYKFIRKCSSCNKDHMSYLCPEISKEVTPKKTEAKSSVSKSSKVNSGIVWAENAVHTNVGEETLLPTFSGFVKDRKIRGLKDTGCQPHFCTSKLADELNLSVIDADHVVTVNGFNEARSYKTTVVSVPLTIGSQTHHIEAICVPSIRTNLNLPGLSHIVQAFKTKGYKLADDALGDSDEVTDIDLILGMRNPDILMESQVSFGSSECSVFSRTADGILLYGSLPRMKVNLPHLPIETTYVVAEGGESIGVDLLAGSVAALEHPPLDAGAAAETVSSNLIITNDKGIIDVKALERAAEQVLQSQCNSSLNYDETEYSEDSVELNEQLVSYVLDNTSREADGRLIMPLLWKGDVAQYLGKNKHLSEKILSCIRRKDAEKVRLIDESIKEWEELGFVEKISDLQSFLVENPSHSFLPLMGVFRMERETTKCRVVFLSNLCEQDSKKQVSMSHNQVMHPGPSLNQRMTSAVMHLRFDHTLVCYDLVKAFLQIALRPEDCNKLLFLWFRNVGESDFAMVAYRNLRLSFGLRCSPFILMLAMYKVLCLDTEKDPQKLKVIKKKLYALMYMDNGAFTGSTSEVKEVLELLPNIFNPYGFEVQQICTNDESLQREIDGQTESETPSSVKLLGLTWDRLQDRLSSRKLELNEKANTKRLILQSIASQFDPFNFQGPCLNRGRLFLHSLQLNKALSWDTKLDPVLQKQWRNIAKQVNKSKPVTIPREFGARTDSYDLVAFTDASRKLYAAVVYIRNRTDGRVGFLMAKNRVVNRQLSVKTIPSLELQAITLGVEMLSDLKEELSGSKCLFPIQINQCFLFTDSSISLHWIRAQTQKLSKMQKLSVFSQNRLNYVERQCEKLPITFSFTATNTNPADCMSRCLSHAQLAKSCYLRGPKFLSNLDDLSSDLTFTVPKVYESSELECHVCDVETELAPVPLVSFETYSSLKRLIKVHQILLRVADRLRSRLKRKNPEKYPHFSTNEEYNKSNYQRAFNLVISLDQKKFFPEAIAYLQARRPLRKDLPPEVGRLNLVLSPQDNILRVKSKFDRWRKDPNFRFPVLLHKDSWLAYLLIRDTHERMSHAGCYVILSHLRKQFWIAGFFSRVKRILKVCVVCRRQNARPVKLTQNSYRPFRANPPAEAYKYTYLDYLGPFTSKVNGENKKHWLLCVTCLWSRAVNLIICPDLTTKSFLRALQIQVFQEGLPSFICSDLGTQIVAGAHIVKDFLDNAETHAYLSENGITSFKFEQYFKGNSALGSLVEVCVKFVKRLMYGAIRNNILPYHDFEYVVQQTIHLVNKRPVSFKEGLRDETATDIPAVITPELLVKGRDLVSLNIVPALQPDPEDHPDWVPSMGSQESLRQSFSKLRKVRKNLIKVYNNEFRNVLVDQATDKQSRYAAVKHDQLQVGDLILLKEEKLKASQYPLAIVTEVVKNDIEEVTDVVARKGNTRETVKRHVTSVIFLLRNKGSHDNTNSHTSAAPSLSEASERPRREAAKESLRRIGSLGAEGLV